MKNIKILHNNLLAMRHYLGLSAKELGDMIGVTRQTINNIESGKNRLTKTQYLAIIYVLTKDIIPNLDEEDKLMINKLLNVKVKECTYGKTIKFEEEA